MFCIPLCAQTAESVNKSQGQVEPTYLSGEKIKVGELPGAYNQSASYVCNDGWDVDVTADYVYWKWQQDSLQLGTVVAGGSLLNVISLDGDSYAVFQNPGYKSGFQVGVGFNMPGMDDWHLYSEYTCYRNTDNNILTTSVAHPFVFSGTRSPESELQFLSYSGTITSEAKLGFQSLDFLVERSFYSGKKLTADIGVGLRSQWISQKLSSSSPFLVDETFGNLTISNLSFVYHMKSWGLGPKLMLNTNWLLGYGIKALANFGTSILYTQYNSRNSHDQNIPIVGVLSSREKGLDNYGTLRAVTEAFLGLGWGSYFCNDRFYTDLSVGYDFNVFWDYNMMFAASSQTIGSMYLHGMNIQLRFDF